MATIAGICEGSMGILRLGLLAAMFCAADAQQPALRHSDVVFMLPSNQATYAEYGATVVTWGAAPTPGSHREPPGLKILGSVGMVTEFDRYYERFPETYEQGLCRDVNSNPVAVPWLTDHRHKNIPYWWCCTNQPVNRQYLCERVVKTIEAGADGLHIDDHLGTAGGLWFGLCFCDRCVDGFRGYLAKLPSDQLRVFDIADRAQFDYRQVIRKWQADDPSSKRSASQHPLWRHWTIYQCRAAADFVKQLRQLATETAGHEVPIAANVGILTPPHLCDFASLDLFSAETVHHAEGRRLSDAPLTAYRMADAVLRPYASTASGSDWAYVKEHELDGLVRGWIALSYAAGHRLMAPHRQWCYTPQKGTHWYEGPSERYAPLYRFVRDHAEVFDGYESHADLTVVLPHRSFVNDASRWLRLFEQLAAENYSYRIELAGDEIVDHPLPATLARSQVPIWLPEENEFLPEDQQAIKQLLRERRVLRTMEEVRDQVHPAVHVQASQPIRILPRVRPNSAVVHLLNLDYDPERDEVRPLRDVEVVLDLAALGVPGARECQFLSPELPARQLLLEGNRVHLPQLDLWGILILR